MSDDKAPGGHGIHANRDYDAFMAERVRLAAAEAGKPGKEEAHTIAAPASTAPASPAFPPLPLAQGGWRVTPWILALDPHGAPCRTSPSVELHATLVSAPIQAELEAGQHVYAEQCQWARPPVQWGNVRSSVFLNRVPVARHALPTPTPALGW